MTTHEPKPDREQRLCLACGLCCNGVLFADVELQAGDNPTKLNQLGLSLKIRSGRRGHQPKAEPTIRFPQPCPGLLGFRCTLYPHRPQRCRLFDCSLLLRLRAGTTTESQALHTIRDTQAAATLVAGLLQTLGESNTATALSIRFQRLRRRLEHTPSADEEAAAVYADLTLAVHDLQRRLRQSFYP